MSLHRSRIVVSLVSFLLLISPLTALLRPARASATTPPATLYTVADLGTLGGRNSVAVSLNHHLQVVGWSEIDPASEDVFHAFIWDAGTMTDLGTLGGASSLATAINDDGLIVGWAENADGERRAVLWQDGVPLELGSLGGNESAAVGINERGQVVGWSDVAPGAEITHAFVWEAGNMVDLGVVGETSSNAHAINDHGQVVGLLEDASDLQAAVTWSGDEITLLAGDSIYARGLNNQGQISGGIDANGDPHAALWDATGVIDLGTLGGKESYATGIDDAGRVVGGAFSVAEEMRAFVWEAGVMRDLGSLGGRRSSATAIADDGSISGWATTEQSEQHAVLWTVSPSPAQPTATPAREAVNLLSGSVQVIEGTSALADCAGTATWLAATAADVDPLFLPLFGGSNVRSMTDYRLALEQARHSVEQRQPPPAAAALNAHIISMVDHILEATQNSIGDTDLLSLVVGNEQSVNDLLEWLALSRQLKRDCNLVNSPQFFDPTCYGIESAEWYSRTYARWLALIENATTLQAEISEGPGENETEDAFIARVTAEVEPFLQDQLAEETPPAMQRLQQHYVDLFALLTSMWRSVITGKQSIDQAQHAATVMVTFAQRETARLDIACPE